MKIRAITLGDNLNLFQAGLPNIRNNLCLISNLQTKFENIGIDVEYVRFSSPPFDKRLTWIKSIHILILKNVRIF